jgi:hypothetical protein
LREQIQQICLSSRCYGSRRVTAALRAQGRLINRKRVVRLMRADNYCACANGALFVPPIPGIPMLSIPISHAMGNRMASTNSGSPISLTSGCGNRFCMWQ